MDIINSLLQGILSVLGTALPALGVPDSFFTSLDSAVSMFITFLQGASWFVDLNIFLLCLSVIIIVDNFSFIVRVITYVLKLIRG